MQQNKLRDFLDAKAAQYNHLSFIKDDPISIPHRFSKQQDIEIAGFFAAILAWGTRKGIINSCNRLLSGMDNSPYDFIMQTNWNDDPEALVVFNGFVHRTFNDMDLFHLLNFLQYHYRTLAQTSLETAFSKCMQPKDDNIEEALIGFHQYVFGYSEEASLERHCRKHISTPLKKSGCKRLNMFLRWMVRQDNSGVDFGIWKTIKPYQLVMPIDVHVSRVAKRLNILQRTQNDWQAAVELTGYLKQLDAADPVKYDYALFGLGVMEKY